MGMMTNRKNRKWGLAVLTAVMMLLLTACSNNVSTSEFVPKENSIFVFRDGLIRSALVETYEEEYYSEEELREFLILEIHEYNQSGKTEKPVTLVSCQLKDGTASAVFDYGSAADYLLFAKDQQDTSNTLSSLDTMKVSEGLASGMLLDAEFENTKGAAVDAEKITRQSDLNMVAAKGSALIQTEGKVQYISKGCTLVDSFTVQTPEDGRAYIIYK